MTHPLPRFQRGPVPFAITALKGHRGWDLWSEVQSPLGLIRGRLLCMIDNQNVSERLYRLKL
jgi:hypothetical protein